MLKETQVVPATAHTHKNPTEYQIPSSGRLIRLPTVIAMTGLSRSSIYRLVAEGKFPAMRKIHPTGRASGWLLADIEAFVRGAA